MNWWSAGPDGTGSNGGGSSIDGGQYDEPAGGRFESAIANRQLEWRR